MTHSEGEDTTLSSMVTASPFSILVATGLPISRTEQQTGLLNSLHRASQITPCLVSDPPRSPSLPSPPQLQTSRLLCHSCAEVRCSRREKFPHSHREVTCLVSVTPQASCLVVCDRLAVMGAGQVGPCSMASLTPFYQREDAA